ncbi:MAG TPA: PilZ domain-containing protein [Acidimicrobiales bacterium]|nr:PilZ domain-containing protein [Acidimicrobiales bacterium]
MSDLPAEVFPERVELEVQDSDPPVTLMCRMSSFSERGVILVAETGAADAFPAGTRVRASYGDHSGFCQFVSEVVSAVPAPWATEGGENVAVLVRVLAPTRVSTTQRRRYVRSDVEVEIACALLDRPAMTFRAAPGEVRNLGGGGLMMVIAAHPSLVVGAELALAIPAPGGDPVLALGRVVQALPQPEGPVQLRMAFTSIDAVGRDRIERFVYRRLGGSAPAKLWSSGKITQTRDVRLPATEASTHHHT